MPVQPTHLSRTCARSGRINQSSRSPNSGCCVTEAPSRPSLSVTASPRCRQVVCDAGRREGDEAGPARGCEGQNAGFGGAAHGAGQPVVTSCAPGCLLPLGEGAGAGLREDVHEQGGSNDAHRSPCAALQVGIGQAKTFSPLPGKNIHTTNSYIPTPTHLQREYKASLKRRRTKGQRQVAGQAESGRWEARCTGY